MKIDYELASSRLNILQYLSSFYPADFFKDFYFIGCQHLLPSTHLMLRSCFDMGLKPERAALIGKCYSTSIKSEALMRSEGIYVCPSSSQFDSHESYDEQFGNNMSVFLKTALDRLKIPPKAKLIVLDDGGELISLVNSISSQFERVICVEQTSAGYFNLLKSALKVPVINVARCSAKLIVESPIVSEAQSYQITRAIDNLGLRPKRILIIGNGALGQCLSRTFQSRYDVVCYDKLPHRSDVDKNDLDFSSFDLIIGATGESSLSLESIPSLKEGVILASASSSDREFSAPALRKKVKRTTNCHKDLFMEGIHLLNCGFPLNFQGSDEDSIPLEKIQLVIALLFAAICQGVSKLDSETGFVKLDYNYQRIILEKLSMLPLMYKEKQIQQRVYKIPVPHIYKDLYAKEFLKQSNLL